MEFKSPVDNQILTSSHRIIARQYRNRRIGDFLKELHLTEGRATGFPTIYDAMEKNGSPIPVFDSDDSTYVLVTIPVHDSFSVQAIEESNQGGSQVKDLSFNNLEEIYVFCNQAGNQASAQVKTILQQFAHGKVKEILLIADSWLSREQLLKNIGLSNHHKNKVKYLDPLEHYGWIEIKYPDNRTHPEQRYKISESGKRLLEIINK